MKKAMRDHLYAYGRFLGFLTRYGQLSDGMQEREPSVDFLALDLSCSSCFSFCTRDCQQYPKWSRAIKLLGAVLFLQSSVHLPARVRHFCLIRCIGGANRAERL
jgi:hypothetical protein